MIGKLRHRISLQSVTLTSDGAGGSTESWAEVAELWAAIEPASARERLFAGKLEQILDAKLRT